MTETYQSYLVVQLPFCVELLERLKVLPEDGDVRLQKRVSIGLRRKKNIAIKCLEDQENDKMSNKSSVDALP